MTVSHVTVAVSVIRTLLPDIWHVKQTVFNNNNFNNNMAGFFEIVINWVQTPGVSE